MKELNNVISCHLLHVQLILIGCRDYSETEQGCDKIIRIAYIDSWEILHRGYIYSFTCLIRSHSSAKFKSNYSCKWKFELTVHFKHEIMRRFEINFELDITKK